MDKNVMYVETFGGFSMTINDMVLTSGTKSDDTQLARLMQILLHFTDRGVERSKLIQILDEDSNADDVHHLLRSVLYNARKKLKTLGLPESNYIVFKNGRYYWTEDIPVVEDARQFEEKCAEAVSAADPDERLRLLGEACYLYKGEFLPYQTRLIWVSEEERRYSQMFHACVGSYADMLRESHNYAEMELVGKHASKVSPYNEWEALTMEALVAQGRHRDAQELYEKTIDMYQKEMGVKPSAEMISKLNAFSERLEHRSTTPEIIQKELSEDDVKRGGYFCTYPVFEGIYRQMRRSMDRCGRYAYLMIITLVNGNTIEDASHTSPDNEQLSRLSDNMKSIICESVRRSDIVCRYAKDQFILILMNRNIEGCEVVRDRINRKFKDKGYNLTLEYDISPVRELEKSACDVGPTETVSAAE